MILQESDDKVFASAKKKGNKLTQMHGSLRFLVALLVGITIPSLLLKADSKEKGSVSNKQFFTNSRVHLTAKSTLIISFPSQLNVFLSPVDKIRTINGQEMSVAEDKNFVGLTPLRLELDPGVYALAIGSDENPIDSGPDGETNRIEVLDGNGGFVPAYKQYSLTKVEGKVAILISVFYPKEQGIKQLLTSLPKEDLFDSPKLTEGAFSENFIRYGVPKVLWQDLVAMFQKTGKFYWSGTSATEYMLEQWISLDRLGNPKEIGIQPVKE